MMLMAITVSLAGVGQGPSNKVLAGGAGKLCDKDNNKLRCLGEQKEEQPLTLKTLALFLLS